MTADELAAFSAQLRGAVASAERRGHRVIAYEWSGGHLRYSTAPARRERHAPAPPAPKRISRGVQASFL